MDVVKLSHDKKIFSRLFKERLTNPSPYFSKPKQKFLSNSPQRYFVIAPMVPKTFFVNRSGNKIPKPIPFSCIKAYKEEKKNIQSHSDSSSYFRPLKSKLIQFLSPVIYHNYRRAESESVKKTLPPLQREVNVSCIQIPRRQTIFHNSRTPQPVIKKYYEYNLDINK